MYSPPAHPDTPVTFAYDVATDVPFVQAPHIFCVPFPPALQPRQGQQVQVARATAHTQPILVAHDHGDAFPPLLPFRAILPLFVRVPQQYIAYPAGSRTIQLSIVRLR